MSAPKALFILERLFLRLGSQKVAVKVPKTWKLKIFYRIYDMKKNYFVVAFPLELLSTLDFPTLCSMWQKLRDIFELIFKGLSREQNVILQPRTLNSASVFADMRLLRIIELFGHRKGSRAQQVSSYSGADWTYL